MIYTRMRFIQITLSMYFALIDYKYFENITVQLFENDISLTNENYIREEINIKFEGYFLLFSLEIFCITVSCLSRNVKFKIYETESKILRETLVKTAYLK
jgi:hypothetical protein